MQPLTDRQKQVLTYIADYLEQNACPPTLREISEHIGTKGTATAILHLDALERKGHIHRRDGSRGITLTRRTGNASTVPILGTIRAGIPEPALEDIQGYVSLDPSWLKGAGNFVLKVKGDSMVGAGIFDGDFALVRPQANADNGQIVVALIDGEATLKRFYREQNQIRLQPENSDMEPIIIKEGDAETVIAGLLLKTIRSFE